MSKLGNERKLSVLIVSAFDPLEGEGRELIRYPILARELVKSGAEVTYVCSSFDHFSKSQRTTSFSNLPYRVELIPTPAYSQNIGLKRIWNHYVFGEKLLSYVRGTTDSFDLILSAYPPISGNHRLSKWAHKNNIPFIIDIQDLWPDAFLTKLPALLGRTLLSPLFRQRKAALQQATRVISVSQDYISTLKIEPSKSAVFPLGAHFPERPFGEKTNETINMILVAGSDSLPFLPSLIQSMYNLPDSIQLLLVGRSKAFLAVEPSARISVYYDADEDQKHELLSQADIGLVLNDQALVSRMPNKVFSYLCYGLPIISNLSDGELGKKLQSEKWGFTCQPDLADFSHQVNKLIGEELHFRKSEIYDQAKTLFDKKIIYEDYARYLLEQIS